MPKHSIPILLLSLCIGSAQLSPAMAQDPNQGEPIVITARNQIGPVCAPDGAGGAIVAWMDDRNSNLDVYAQHLLPGGKLDPAWPTTGRALCTAASGQTGLKIIPDGS